MAIRYIPNRLYIESLRERREWSMGYHFVQNEVQGSASLAVAATILVDLDDDYLANARRLSGEEWLVRAEFDMDRRDIPYEAQASAFDSWCDTLEVADSRHLQPAGPDVLARFVLDPFDPVATPRGPNPPTTSKGRPSVHGHLPFTGRTTEETVFYRAEPFPSSRAISRTNGQVTVGDGLYGFPPSELYFVPTGFAAVGRYALPNVAPSIYRWELRAPAGVAFSAGASVPLFGQAGGGVEICIEQDFQNVGHIADPVVLPHL